MKKTVFYKKEGRRYVPVREYDQELMDAMPKGSHLICVYPGGKSARYNVDPNYAAMIAAGRIAEDVISKELVKRSDLRPQKNPITLEQKAAWENLSRAFGQDIHLLEWPSAREVCEKTVEVMMAEAEKLLTNPAVKRAFDNFLLVAELCKESSNDN